MPSLTSLVAKVLLIPEGVLGDRDFLLLLAPLFAGLWYISNAFGGEDRSYLVRWRAFPPAHSSADDRLPSRSLRLAIFPYSIGLSVCPLSRC